MTGQSGQFGAICQLNRKWRIAGRAVMDCLPVAADDCDPAGGDFPDQSIGNIRIQPGQLIIKAVRLILMLDPAHTHCADPGPDFLRIVDAEAGMNVESVVACDPKGHTINTVSAGSGHQANSVNGFLWF